jgi:hypothetical protein
MKHRKKMLQYAQDAQVTDTPWEWWEWKYHEDSDWHELYFSPSWYGYAEYRRKPQWEIDGKFKVGDQVTFADTPEVRGLGQSRSIGEMFTVIGFVGRKKVNYYVQFKNDSSITHCCFPQSCIEHAPKFKIGDRVCYVNACRVSEKQAETGDVCIVERSDGWCDPVSASQLKLATQRLEALSKAVGFDVPMPLQEAPKDGTAVYSASNLIQSKHRKSLWSDNPWQRNFLKANMLHLAFENAEIHAKALAAISSPHFCP